MISASSNRASSMPTAVFPLAVGPVKYQNPVSGFGFKVSGWWARYIL
jgi:hypothetical protein